MCINTKDRDISGVVQLDLPVADDPVVHIDPLIDKDTNDTNIEDSELIEILDKTDGITCHATDPPKSEIPIQLREFNFHSGTRGLVMSIPVAVNGIPATAILDTGAEATILGEHFMKYSEPSFIRHHLFCLKMCHKVNLSDY